MADTGSSRALLKLLSAQLSGAFESISKLESAAYGDLEREEVELETLIFKDRLDDAYTTLSTLLEVLGLTSSLAKLRDEYAALEKERTRLKMAPSVDAFYNDSYSLLRRYEQTLEAYFGAPEQDVLVRLQSILNNSAQIVADAGIEPKSEAELRRPLYNVIKLWFPDTTLRAGIVQPTKNYVPDIGVPSLKTTIELKFANSEQEMKKAVGELYTDMHGYEGSEDWTHHFGLIYATKPAFTSDQVAAELKRVKANLTWRIVTVLGVGARQRQKKKLVPQPRRGGRQRPK
jgi:hypothetical protein